MGSSGGGGSSGAVSYPAHMSTVHADWLDNTGNDNITSSITDVMDAALGSSPWTGLSAYDPGADIAAYEAAVSAFAAILAGITDAVDWAALYSQSILSIGTPDALAIGDREILDKVVNDIVDVENIVIADKVVDDAAVADIDDTSDVDGITEAVIIADVGAFSDQLDDEIITKVLPRFRRGMQDINAVVSSSFAIGQAIIEGFRDREVAKHNSAIRLEAAYKNADINLANESLHLDVKRINVGKDTTIAGANLSKDVTITGANLSKDVEVNGSNLTKDVEIGRSNLTKNLEIGRANLSKDVEIGRANLVKDVEVGSINLKTDVQYLLMYLEGSSQMLRLMIQRITWEEAYTRTVVESNRIKIVAKKEQTDTDAMIDRADGLWDLEVFQFGANLLASIGGGTAMTSSNAKPNVAMSVIGGAMSGAAAGAMIGGPYGAIIGGVLGAAVGFLGTM